MAEYVLTGRMSFGALALLFVGLRLQAERAAALYAKYGLAGKPKSPWELAAEEEPWIKPEPKARRRRFTEEKDEEAAETIHVNPLGGKGKGRVYEGAPGAAPSTDEALRLPPPQERTARMERPAPHARPAEAPKPRHRQPKGQYREPHFGGSPADVLGVTREAGTKQIQHAFRFWMKRYHPDHAGPGESAKATERARQLTEARDALLRARRRAREPRSA